MPKREVSIRVSEPTMSNGVWTLAQWQWRALSIFSHEEIADSIWPRDACQEIERHNMGLQFDEWLASMPAVEDFERPIDIMTTRDFATDTIRVRGVARGWFSLSDDEAKTERMLGLVNVDAVPGMAHLYWDDGSTLRRDSAEFATRAARESLLRLGSVDNDINPDFTTEPLRWRATERYIAPSAACDWRVVYGTSSNDSVDVQRRRLATAALREMLDAAVNNPVDAPLPDESSAGTLPSNSSEGGET